MQILNFINISIINIENGEKMRFNEYKINVGGIEKTSEALFIDFDQKPVKSTRTYFPQGEPVKIKNKRLSK